MMETRYARTATPAPEVVIREDSVLIGEEDDQVRLSTAEWNVLVTAINEGHLGPTRESATVGACGCGCACGASAS
jgi:hypothetical protein